MLSHQHLWVAQNCSEEALAGEVDAALPGPSQSESGGRPGVGKGQELVRRWQGLE